MGRYTLFYKLIVTVSYFILLVFSFVYRIVKVLFGEPSTPSIMIEVISLPFRLRVPPFDIGSYVCVVIFGPGRISIRLRKGRCRIERPLLTLISSLNVRLRSENSQISVVI